MAEWNPLDNPTEVGGYSGSYYTKTFSEQDEKRRKQKEAQQKQQTKQQQAKLKREAEEQAKAQQREALTVNPVEAISSVLAPVGDALLAPFEYISDRFEEAEVAIFGEQEAAKRRQRAEEVRKGQRTAFQSEDLTPQQKLQNQQNAAKLKQDLEAPLDVLRVPAKAALAGVEGVLNIASQAGLDLSVNQGKEPDQYIRASWDFGLTPKTKVGKFAANILGFAVTTRQVGKRLGKLEGIGQTPIPEGLKGAQWWAAKGKRIITDGLIPGAIADFILTDPTDGNISRSIQQLFPEEYHDAAWFALAADPDDNPWLNRFKSTLEGGPLNAVGNTVAGLFKARSVAQAVKKAGGSNEEAVAKGVDVFTKETDAAAKSADISDAEEGIRWSEASETELNHILNREAALNEDLARIDPDLEPEEAIRIDEELKALQVEKADLESRIYENADPDVKREFWETQASTNPAKPTQTVIDQTIGSIADDGTGRISRAARNRTVFTDAQVRIMNLDDGQKSVIDEFQRKIDFKEVARKTGRTVDELKATAESILNRVDDKLKDFDEVMSEQDLLRALAEAGGTLVEPKGTFATAEGAITVKTLIDDFSKKIFDIAYAAEELDYSSIGGFNNYDRLIDRFVGLLGIYKESASYHGSGLNGFKVRLKAALSGKEQVMREMEEADELTYGQLKKWADKIKQLSRSGDPEAKEQLRSMTRAMVLANGDPANTISYAKAVFNLWRGGAENIFYNNMLSGFKTMVRNMSGITRVVLDPAAIALRGTFAGDEAQVQAGLAGLNAIHSSIGEAWKIAKIAFKSETSITGTSQNIIDKAQVEAGIQMMEQMAANDLERIGVGFAKFTVRFGQALNLPGKLLMSQDDFVKTIIARQRIAEMATLDAFKEAPNVSDRADFVMKYMEKYSKYIDPQSGKILDKGLAVYADIGTFQDNPGAAVNAFTSFIDNIPFGRYLVPFIRTPANIMRYQIEYLPLLSKFSKKYTEAVKNGDELMVAELEGRQAVGSLVFATAFGLGLTGNWTGNLPIDPAERQRWKTLGIRPRSVKVGSMWVSYNVIEPLNNIIAAAVDLSTWAKLFGEENVGGQEILERFAGQLTLAIAASFTEKSYFANFEALSSFIDVGQMTPDKVQSMMAGFAYTQTVPWAMGVRGFANSFDSYMREYDNEWQRVFVGNLPILRNQLPAMIDVLTGKPMKNPNGNLWNANMPFEVSVDQDDPVKNMLMKARYNWRDNLDTYKGISLNGEQKKFVREQMYESGLRKDLSHLMKQEWFQKDMDKFRNRPINFNDPDAQPRFYRSIAEAFTSAKQTAFARLEAADAKFADELRQRRITTAEYRVGIYSDKQRRQPQQQQTEAQSNILDQVLQLKK